MTISLSQRLDKETRHYWEKHIPLRGRRINMFARNLYRYGLLGRFIGILHAVAKLHGKKLEPILAARTPEEQRRLFERDIAPLFDYKSIRLLSKSPVSLYALGIPPAQYDELVSLDRRSDRGAARTGRAAGLRLSRSTKIISPGRLSAAATTSSTAPPCRPICGATPTTSSAHGQTRSRCITPRSPISCAAQPHSRCTAYVLLDAQDWMNSEQLTALWREIDRTADTRDARVIFRTAGPDSPLPRKLPADVLAPWAYLRRREPRLARARTAPPSMAAFTSMPAGHCPEPVPLT